MCCSVYLLLFKFVNGLFWVGRVGPLFSILFQRPNVILSFLFILSSIERWKSLFSVLGWLNLACSCFLIYIMNLLPLLSFSKCWSKSNSLNSAIDWIIVEIRTKHIKYPLTVMPNMNNFKLHPLDSFVLLVADEFDNKIRIGLGYKRCLVMEFHTKHGWVKLMLYNIFFS